MVKKDECKLGKFLAEKLCCTGKLRPEKREAIICAAIMEIEKRGFQGASMDRIALKARVSKRTVYNHFGSKENLIKTLIQARMEEVKGAVHVDYDPKAPLHDQLLSLARQEASFIRQSIGESMTRALLSECIRDPELGGRIFEGLKTNEAGVHLWVRNAAADGRLKAERPDFAADQFMSLIKGILFWPPLIGWTGQPDDETTDLALNGAVDMFLARYGDE